MLRWLVGGITGGNCHFLVLELKAGRHILAVTVQDCQRVPETAARVFTSTNMIVAETEVRGREGSVEAIGDQTIGYRDQTGKTAACSS